MSTAIARPAPNAAPASDGQPGVGAAADDDEDEVDDLPERRPPTTGRCPSRPICGWAAPPTSTPASAPVDGEAAALRVSAVTVVPVTTRTPWSAEFGGHERAELRVEGGQHLRQPFDHGHREPAGAPRLGHLQADVAGADDQRRAGRPGGEVVGEGERVTHGVQQVHAITGPRTSSPVMGGRTGIAPVAMTSRS